MGEKFTGGDGEVNVRLFCDHEGGKEKEGRSMAPHEHEEDCGVYPTLGCSKECARGMRKGAHSSGYASISRSPGGGEEEEGEIGSHKARAPGSGEGESLLEISRVVVPLVPPVWKPSQSLRFGSFVFHCTSVWWQHLLTLGICAAFSTERRLLPCARAPGPRPELVLAITTDRRCGCEAERKGRSIPDPLRFWSGDSDCLSEVYRHFFTSLPHPFAYAFCSERGQEGIADPSASDSEKVQQENLNPLSSYELTILSIAWPENQGGTSAKAGEARRNTVVSGLPDILFDQLNLAVPSNKSSMRAQVKLLLWLARRWWLCKGEL
ncbi:hypothetical protein R1flu_026473 [Riccia fluitans]|uniref:Uncharacterized protein n=1 Tax=Riccia fluitans TaxID=41844 RepID=A0ABD1XGJ7_9MARC